MIESWAQCGQVTPEWVDIGWVCWSGTPEREKLFTIRYLRCTSTPLPPVQRDGFTHHLCAAHAAHIAAENYASFKSSPMVLPS